VTNKQHEHRDVWKRAFDLSLAVAGLIVLWPLLALIAVAIKLSSPGPVFYRGVRTGRYGRPFRIFKFRTMVVDAERLGSVTTSENDPRITKVGALLRKYKLDELPQLFNVLLGDMSFVGPRPEVVPYTDRYTEEERIILTVRPGITDWASIHFNDLQAVVGEGDAERVYRERVLPRKMELRMKYVRERSFTADMRILAETLWTILRRPLRKG
jgi:lipopolysaccharide/colanic/teichoic acid biosynthesis glycosyltransferase